jgi:putative membrane protein
MIHLIVNWLLSALALCVAAYLIPGIQVRDFGAALIATVVIAIVNFFFGPILRFFGLPLIIVTLGLFGWVINAALLKLASMFTPGFRIHGFFSALAGSLVLTVIGIITHAVYR